MEQWQIVMDHMMTRGIMAHIVLTEQENQSLFEYLAGWPASGFADSRKLFFREMVARFGHLNALTWNIGEESGLSRDTTYELAVTDAQRKAFADWMRSLTYYEDHLVVHNGPWNNDTLLLPLLGHASFTGLSYQGDIYSDTAYGYDRIKFWRTTSAAYGHKWVVTYDEPYFNGTPDRDVWRRNVLWPSLVAGAAGVELYSRFDGSLQDYTLFRSLYADMRIAERFLQDNVVPFQAMMPMDTLVNSGWCLARPGEAYVLYLKSGGSTSLTVATGNYQVQWLDPRNGGALLRGSVTTIPGPGTHSLGNPPNSAALDWVVYVRNTGSAQLYSLNVSAGTGSGSYAAQVVVNLAAVTPPSGQVFDRWIGNVANVADIYAISTTITMPAANATVSAAYNSGSISTLSFYPTDDAYLEGTTRFNDAYLKVEAGARASYLKFTVSGLSGTVQRAILQLQENGDPGDATLRVHRGSHNNWIETTLSDATAPAESGQIGISTGTIAINDSVSLDVTPWITGNGTYTAIVKLDAGGNDIWFGSEESARKPQLIVETSGSGSSPYALTVNSGSGSGSYLKVEAGNRMSYLKFTVSDVSGAVTERHAEVGGER